MKVESYHVGQYLMMQWPIFQSYSIAGVDGFKSPVYGKKSHEEIVYWGVFKIDWYRGNKLNGVNYKVDLNPVGNYALCMYSYSAYNSDISRKDLVTPEEFTGLNSQQVLFKSEKAAIKSACLLNEGLVRYYARMGEIDPPEDFEPEVLDYDSRGEELEELERLCDLIRTYNADPDYGDEFDR
jgi:hypothetical protein